MHRFVVIIIAWLLLLGTRCREEVDMPRLPLKLTASTEERSRKSNLTYSPLLIDHLREQ